MDIRRMADSRVQNTSDGGYILLSTGRNLSFKYSLYEGASTRGCLINNTNYENETLISGIHFCCLSLPFQQTSYWQAVTLTCRHQGYEFFCPGSGGRANLAYQEKLCGILCLPLFLENPLSSTLSVSSPDSTLLYLFHPSVVTTGVPTSLHRLPVFPCWTRSTWGMWERPPDPDLLGRDTTRCLQNVSLFLATESRGKLLSRKTRIPVGDIFPGTHQTS